MPEPLVLLPSLLADARIWGAQIETLSADRAVQLAYFGRANTIEDMAAEALDSAPSSFALAGHGLGGMVAIEMMRRAPDRVRRLALLSTTCLPEMPPGAAERDVRIARAKAGRLKESMAEEVPHTALSPGKYHQEVADFMAAMANDQGSEAYLRQAAALQRRPDGQRTLRAVRVPTLILCGVHDTLYPPRRHEFMAGLVIHSELVVLDGAGHVPMIERPDAVNAALGQWLNRDDRC